MYHPDVTVAWILYTNIENVTCIAYHAGVQNVEVYQSEVWR